MNGDVTADFQVRLRHGRAERATEGLDDLEHTDADSVADLAFSVLQIRAQLAMRIGQALWRIEAGRYGRCVDCEEDILERRLRALPFAVRCLGCEALRELAAGPVAPMPWRRGGLSFFGCQPSD